MVTIDKYYYRTAGFGRGNSLIICPTELQNLVPTLIFKVSARSRVGSTLFEI